MSEENKQESKGLGDSIKKVTETLGIKQCSKCKKRQEALNKMFPYKTKQHQKNHQQMIRKSRRTAGSIINALRKRGSEKD